MLRKRRRSATLQVQTTFLIIGIMHSPDAEKHRNPVVSHAGKASNRRKELNMSKTGYAIKHDKNQIVFEKGFLQRANDVRSPEYKAMAQLKKDWPDYEMTQKKIAKNANKKSYENLDLEYMRIHIANQEGDHASDLEAFDKMTNKNAREFHKSFAYIRKWFLDRYEKSLPVTIPSKEERKKAQ